MRRAAWAFALLLMCCAPAFAAVRYGFDIGVSSSSFHYDRDTGFPYDLWGDRHRKVVPTIGGVVEAQLGERFGFTTGLRYVQHGIEVDLDDLFQTGFENTLHYVSAPLLLTMRPLASRRLLLAVGPEFAVLVAADTEYKGTGQGSGFDIKDSLVPLNVSLDGEFGVEFPMGQQTGLVSARYSHGITGVAKPEAWTIDWNTRGVEVLFGVRW